MDRRHMRVLVVEDAADLLEIYRRHLTRMGCEVLGAATGRVALDLAPGFDPDLAFVDTILPDMLGTSVVDTLRTDPRTARCVLVIASGLDAELQDTHGDAVMPKPFTGSDLEAILRWYADRPEQAPRPIPGTGGPGGTGGVGGEDAP
jgi:two-component system alkaline phosphatase synthesis response regulator PhoP